VCYGVLDAVEVQHAVYHRKDKEIVLGCGVPGDDASTAPEFAWFRNEKEIHSDEHLVIAERKDSNYSFSTVTIKKIGKMLYGCDMLQLYYYW